MLRAFELRDPKDFRDPKDLKDLKDFKYLIPLSEF